MTRRRTCRAPGCDALTTRFGAYCSTHKSRNRRHGSPDQRGITKADLKPYLALVRRRIEKNSALNVWRDLTAQWDALLEECREYPRTTIFAAVRRAAQELAKVGADVRAEDVTTTVLAIYLMREDSPHRFKSDKAFDTQLVRRVRALTDRNATFSTSRTSGRSRKVYSELSPKVTAVMAMWIVKALGGAAVWMARRETEERKAKDQARVRLSQGLAEIDFA